MPAIRAKRWALLIVLLLIAIIGLIVGYWKYESPAKNTNLLTLYGNVDLREIQLAFNDQGRIQQLSAIEGESVRQGDILGHLDDRRYQLALQRTQAQTAEARAHLEDLLAGSRPEEINRLKAEVSAAKATLELRRISYRRIERLTHQKVSSLQTLDNARAAYKDAAAQLKAYQASLALALAGPRKKAVTAARATLAAARASEALASRELTDTNLMSPANGIIRTRILEPGDMASPQQPVLTLALTQPVWVRAYVDEPQLGRVHPGQMAWVTSDSFPGQRFKAWVGYVSPTAEFTPKTVETAQLRTSLVYQIRVFVCNPDNKLRLGMPATVHIKTASSQPAVQQSPCLPHTKPLS